MFLSADVDCQGTVFCNVEEDEVVEDSLLSNSTGFDRAEGGRSIQALLTNGDLVWIAEIKNDCLNKNLDDDKTRGMSLRKRIEAWFGNPYALQIEQSEMKVNKMFGPAKKVAVATVPLVQVKSAEKTGAMRRLLERGMQIMSSQATKIKELNAQVDSIKQSYDELSKATKENAAKFRKQKDELTLKLVTILNAKKEALRLARGSQTTEEGGQDSDADADSKHGDSDLESSSEGSDAEVKDSPPAKTRKTVKTKSNEVKVAKSKPANQESPSKGKETKEEKKEEESGADKRKESGAKKKKESGTEKKKVSKPKPIRPAKHVGDELPPCFAYRPSVTKPDQMRYYYHKKLWVEGNENDSCTDVLTLVALPSWWCAGKDESPKLEEWRKNHGPNVVIRWSSRHPPFKDDYEVKKEVKSKTDIKQEGVIREEAQTKISKSKGVIDKPKEKSPEKLPMQKRASKGRKKALAESDSDAPLDLAPGLSSGDSDSDNDNVNNVFGNQFGKGSETKLAITPTPKKRKGRMDLETQDREVLGSKKQKKGSSSEPVKQSSDEEEEDQNQLHVEVSNTGREGSDSDDDWCPL